MDQRAGHAKTYGYEIFYYLASLFRKLPVTRCCHFTNDLPRVSGIKKYRIANAVNATAARNINPVL